MRILNSFDPFSPKLVIAHEHQVHIGHEQSISRLSDVHAYIIKSSCNLSSTDIFLIRLYPWAPFLNTFPSITLFPPTLALWPRAHPAFDERAFLL